MKKCFSLALAVLFCLLAVSPAFAAVDYRNILCVGESLTCGSGANEAGTISTIDQAKTYPARLGGKLGYPYQVYNYGISGVSVLPEYKWEWSAGGYLAAAKAGAGANPLTVSDADMIFLFLGTNDAKDRIWKAPQGTGGAENFYKYYTEIIQTFRKEIRANLQVVCVIPPPVVNREGLNDYEIVDDTLKNEIAPTIRKVASEQHCRVLDLRELFADVLTDDDALTTYYAVDDAVHPNAVGYNRIAEAMVPYARRSIGDVNNTNSNNPDGNPTLQDVTDFAKALAGWSDVTCNEVNADVNVDGKADILDLTLLAKYLADWDVVLY